ncbi:putative flagellum biosynthesis repressor protein FlbT [Kordiimonas sediminis]|uniref:Flagellum biosynthesis repressor protein FlbT n=1 Tax=Kordiimonas sediminis TaxID=1735581 RepID=A0A919AYG0_9PROT|nr:flagellar biosynthesis repressor FlbT [Kordiimonas sediminis]GHF29536.1 putative flagellum biosynthesis repressor protein FlbT [Kordiimonas sediminis]
MALKLSLKPEEKLVINGAVIANGDKRTTLVVQNKASILREKDIMQEQEVTTPARHVYFPIMLMYMDEKNYSQYYDAFVLRMTEFMGAIGAPEVLNMCVQISQDVMARNYYKALMNCKKLIAYEAEVMNGSQ